MDVDCLIMRQSKEKTTEQNTVTVLFNVEQNHERSGSVASPSSIEH